MQSSLALSESAVKLCVFPREHDSAILGDLRTSIYTDLNYGLERGYGFGAINVVLD